MRMALPTLIHQIEDAITFLVKQRTNQNEEIIKKSLLPLENQLQQLKKIEASHKNALVSFPPIVIGVE